MITYNNIIKRLNDFADNHFFIQRFSHGSPEDINQDKFDAWPLLHVVLLSSPISRDDKNSPFVQTYNFEIYILDKPSQKDDKVDRQKEIISDSILVAKDLLADIAQGFSIFVKNELYGVDEIDIVPLEEEFSHVLSGALISLSIQVPAGVSACDLPLTGVTPSTGACADANVLNNAGGASDYDVDVASGGTLNLPNISIIEQDDTVISSAVPSVVDIKVTNADITSVTYPGDHIAVEVDVVTPSGWLYQHLAYDTTDTYENYDIGWWFINRNSSMYHSNPANPATIAMLDRSSAAPHVTLVDNNVHGNKNRFTAQDGTQTISDGDVIEDHLFYMEYINHRYADTYSGLLADSESDTTDGGATNHWRLVGDLEYRSLTCRHDPLFPAIFSTLSLENYWLSDAYVYATTQKHYAWAGHNISRRTPGTTVYAGIYCRKGTW